ncbi:TPA: restriction endonuclease subunit S [Streptococcus suis]
MGSDPTPPAKRRRCHKKALSPRLAKLDKEFEEAGGEWREKEIDEFFDIFNGKRLTKNEIVSGNVPYISSSSVNNGIQEYIEIHDSSAMYENCLSIAYNGKDTAVFYHPYRAFFSDNVRVVKYKDKNAQKFQYLFTANLFKKIRERFNYGNPMSSTKLRKEKIKLPFLNNHIAFSYMENYIKTLEAERIETLEAYLTVTGLKDYHLTKNDEKILDRFAKPSDTESRVEYLGTYTLSDLFYLNSSKRKYNANSIEFGGEFPYVARGESNNGIRGYITEPEEFLNPADSISFGQDTATMFYQKEAYFTGDKIKILQAKDIELDRFTGQYIITAMRKSFSTFSWGSSSFNEHVLKSVEVSLPTQNNQPDYTFMSDFIKVIEKLVIKDLVEWTDKKIQATKEVVAQH